ncbi:acyltransferase [Legionella impletisoli]|uniref:acyltransferase n=1 Tax=Legionella impletisoli TaxID=343510 RepID=UPI0010411C7E|nr:acyltransferase [Legionella impletisoli]
MMVRILVTAIILLLTACAKHPMTPHQIACKAECAKRFEACCKVCKNSCKNCSQCTTQAAARSYAQFKHRQCVQGAMISRELQSFRDPLQCSKTTCECIGDYRICEQSCTGLIHKRLQVAPTCC